MVLSIFLKVSGLYLYLSDNSHINILLGSQSDVCFSRFFFVFRKNEEKKTNEKKLSTVWMGGGGVSETLLT